MEGSSSGSGAQRLKKIKNKSLGSAVSADVNLDTRLSNPILHQCQKCAEDIMISKWLCITSYSFSLTSRITIPSDPTLNGSIKPIPESICHDSTCLRRGSSFFWTFSLPYRYSIWMHATMSSNQFRTQSTGVEIGFICASCNVVLLWIFKPSVGSLVTQVQALDD